MRLTIRVCEREKQRERLTIRKEEREKQRERLTIRKEEREKQREYRWNHSSSHLIAVGKNRQKWEQRRLW